MIIGIGSDLCDIRRIEKTLERFGDRFTHKSFTEIERNRSERKPDRASSYAKRFAAKEACSKALGTGLKGGVHLSGMGVVNLPSGKPTMALTGGAAERLALSAQPPSKAGGSDSGAELDRSSASTRSPGIALALSLTNRNRHLPLACRCS